MGFFDDILHDVGSNLAAVLPHPPEALHAAVQTAARALLGQADARRKIAELGARSPVMRELFGHAHRGLMWHPGFLHACSAAELHRHPVHPSHPNAHGIRQSVKDTMRAVDYALPGVLQSINQAKQTAARLRGSPVMPALPAPFGPQSMLPGFAHAAGALPSGAEELLPGYAHVAGLLGESDESLTGAEGLDEDIGSAAYPAYMVDDYEVGRVHPHGAHGGARHVRAPARPHGATHGRGWRRMHHHAPEDFGFLWGGPFGWGADYLIDEREELGDQPTPDDGEPEWPRYHSGSSWMGD
jgi:hypothetical protein